MSIRERILEEYRAEGFDPKTKLSRIDGDKAYYPCAEKIKFFKADYPSGTIKTEVVMDNNVFATVKAIITCNDGTTEAYGKWYHSNADAFGMNYLSTAQTVAVSKALTFMGYSSDQEDIVDPDGKLNIAPEASAPDDMIPTSPPIDITGNGLSVEQAMATVMYNSPFNGETIKQILSENNPEKISALRDQLRSEVDMQTARAAVAEVILPLIS